MVKHYSIFSFAASQSIERVVDLFERILLNHGFYIMLDGKIEHFRDSLGTPDRRSGYRALTHDQRKDGCVNWFEYSTYEMKSSFRF